MLIRAHLIDETGGHVGRVMIKREGPPAIIIYEDRLFVHDEAASVLESIYREETNLAYTTTLDD